MMPVMSEDSPRRINDYYARVTLQRHHVGNPSESDERIEVVVRIPEEVAKTLAGGRKPSVVIFDVGSRVRNVATETAGVPNDSSSRISPRGRYRLVCTCKPEHLSFAAKTLNRAAKDIETAS